MAGRVDFGNNKNEANSKKWKREKVEVPREMPFASRMPGPRSQTETAVSDLSESWRRVREPGEGGRGKEPGGGKKGKFPIRKEICEINERNKELIKSLGTSKPQKEKREGRVGEPVHGFAKIGR